MIYHQIVVIVTLITMDWWRSKLCRAISWFEDVSLELNSILDIYDRDKNGVHSAAVLVSTKM